MGEELWERLGNTGGISFVPWPEFDEALTVDAAITYVVSVNGKRRGQIALPVDVTKDVALAEARKIENVVKFLEGKDLKREIFVPKRMINFVVK